MIIDMDKLHSAARAIATGVGWMADCVCGLCGVRIKNWHVAVITVQVAIHYVGHDIPPK